MNHTIKSILIVVVITSMLVLGATTVPIMQNSFAERDPNTNTNTNSADSTSSSSATADNTNNINNSACAVAVTCPEGSTTVTPPTATTCDPSTVFGQTATPTDYTCTVTIPFSVGREALLIFESDYDSIPAGVFTFNDRTSITCTFPSR